MSKVYDPILCMMVEKSTKDAAPNMYSLFVDGKVVKVFASIGAPVIEAQKWMKENMPGKIGTLNANRSGAKYTITAKDSKFKLRVGISGKEKTVEIEASSKQEAIEKYKKGTSYPGTVQSVKKVGDSAVERAIKAIDAEKGYELDGFWIKPNDYGVEITKNGKKVGEFASTSEAEKWIRGKYGD